MSYLTFSVAKQGEYWSRPKVLIPEKTESAYDHQLENSQTQSFIQYLSTTISRQSVVPKTLERSFNGSLFVVTVGVGSANKDSGRGKIPHHDGGR